MAKLYNNNDIGGDETEEDNQQFDVDGEHAAHFTVYWSRFHVAKEIYHFQVLRRI